MARFRPNPFTWIALLAAAVILPACSGSGIFPPTPTVFIVPSPTPTETLIPSPVVEPTYLTPLPATATPTPTPTVTPTPTSSPTPTDIPCRYDAEFIEDVTIPDDTPIAAGTGFVKTWRMRNTSTCVWEDGFLLVFVRGDKIGALPTVRIDPTAAGETVDISVEMTAPQTPGTYAGLWQIESPDGVLFGTQAFVQIVVPESGTVVPTLPPTPTRSPLLANVPSYPYVYNITQRSAEIFADGQARGNRAGVFSKVGDSITDNAFFLRTISSGNYRLGQYSQLEDVIQYYSVETARVDNSFANKSLASFGGWMSGDVLNPAKADPLCGGKIPLECEYDFSRPAVAIIMLGTNDCGSAVPHSVWEANMRQIITITIKRGIIPVLSTLPRAEGKCSVSPYNTSILMLARQFEIPYMDYWAIMEPLPNHGLDTDGVHPTSAGDYSAYFTGDYMKFGYNARNLLTLQMLDALWRGVMN